MIHLKDESLYDNIELITSQIINEEVMSQAQSVERIIRENPQKGWKLILKFLQEIPSEHLYLRFVDGPLRLFLSLHGQEYIQMIEEEASDNCHLRKGINDVLRYESSVKRIHKDVLIRLKSVSVSNEEVKARKTSATLINSWLVYKSTFWVNSKLRNLIQSDPDRVWLIILELIFQAREVRTLSYIAAGLLEDILVYHGPEFIERVELKASESKKFRLCLSGVWQNRMSREIWDRVQKALGDENIDHWDDAIPGC